MTWSRFFDAASLCMRWSPRATASCRAPHYLFHRSTTAIEPLCYLQDLFTTSRRAARALGGR